MKCAINRRGEPSPSSTLCHRTTGPSNPRSTVVGVLFPPKPCVRLSCLRQLPRSFRLWLVLPPGPCDRPSGLCLFVGLVEASPSTLKLWQSVRLASSAGPRVSCGLRRFWQAGTLWQPVCLSSNPPPSFAAAAFFVLCGRRAGGRPPPGPARPGPPFSLCFLPPGLVAGGRAGVYLTRGAGGATGGGEYGRGRGIWGIPRPADRSLYSSIFSVCGISISCSGC